MGFTPNTFLMFLISTMITSAACTQQSHQRSAVPPAAPTPLPSLPIPPNPEPSVTVRPVSTPGIAPTPLASATPEPQTQELPTLTPGPAKTDLSPSPAVAAPAPSPQSWSSCRYRSLNADFNIALCIETDAPDNLAFKSRCESDIKKLAPRVAVTLDDKPCPSEWNQLPKRAGCQLEKDTLLETHWDYTGQLPCRGKKVTAESFEHPVK
jgi:hypothetical protein